MKALNVIFTGVGGTGVITAARILATAGIIEGQNVRLGEVHGMSQRLGAVNTAVRIGDNVRGPIIPLATADLLLSIEPIEAIRQIETINPKGTIIVGMHKITPTAVLLGQAEYPSDDEILNDLKKFATVVTINAHKLAQEAGSLITINTVLLGAAVGLGLIPLKEKSIIAALKEVLRERFHEMNIEAFEKGKNAVKGKKPE